jgi:hypothetical protein
MTVEMELDDNMVQMQPFDRIVCPLQMCPLAKMEATRYNLKDDIQHSLQELDDTVASVGDIIIYISPQRRDPEEFSVASRFSDQNSLVDMNRHHIDNMDTMKKISPMFASSCSRKSGTSRSSRRSVSSRSMRRRGPSLERVISQTILKEASSNIDDPRPVVKSVVTIATVDILKELSQAGTVLETEVLHDTNLLSRMQVEEERELLPPCKTQDEPNSVEWRPDWDEDAAGLHKSAEASSPRSRGSVYEAPNPAQRERPSRVVVTEHETFNKPGEKLAEKPFFIDDSDPLFSDDPFGALEDFGVKLQTFPDLETIENDNKWMSFGDNPFQEDGMFLAGPSSIADFARIVDRLPTKSESWHEFQTKFSI